MSDIFGAVGGGKGPVAKAVAEAGPSLPGDLETLISSAKRMKDALDCHLKDLKDEVARRADEGNQIPSRNNVFFYATDPTIAVNDGKGNFTSFIKMQQDAAFVLESILVANPRDPERIYEAYTYEISFQDGNAARDLTGGNHGVTADPVTDPPAALEITDLVPWETVYPTAGSMQDALVAPNVDYWNILSVEQVFPRASVVRIRFRSVGAQGFQEFDDGHPPQVVFCGYKVF